MFVYAGGSSTVSASPSPSPSLPPPPMSSEEYHQSPFEARPAQSSLPHRRLQFPDPAPQQYSSSESANPSSVRNGSARRRVVSVDGKYGYSGVAPVKPRRRPISLIGTVPETSREAGNTSLSADDLSLGTFSDEYDLCACYLLRGIGGD